MDLIYFTGLKDSGWEVLAQHFLNSEVTSEYDVETEQNVRASKFHVTPCDEKISELLVSNKNALCIAFVSDPVLSAFNNATANIKSFSFTESIEKWKEVTTRLLSLSASSNVILVSTSNVLKNTHQFIDYINNLANTSVKTINLNNVYDEQKSLSFGFSLLLNDVEDIDELYENALLRAQVFGSLEYMQSEEASFSEYISALGAIRNEATSKRDSELALLQIHKLQEELEIYHNKQQAAEKQNELLQKEIEKSQKRYSELEALNSDLQKMLKKERDDRQKEIQGLTHQINGFEKREVETSRDADLALRQIHKLQEELERYYIKSLELEEKASHWNAAKYSQLKSYDVLRSAFCSEMNVVEWCEEAHYAHLVLNLSDVVLADGRQVENIECKLVNNSGFAGLEIRAGETGKQKHLISTWPEGLNDEFGQKFLFHPKSPQSDFPFQNAVEWQMSASDRVLVFGIINCIYEHFLASTLTNNSTLEYSKLDKWREQASSLLSCVKEMPDWFSFDSVKLNEEMRLDNYEHLWLNFDNLLHGTRFFDEYQIKINVTELEATTCFAKHLAIEFRTLSKNKAPLESWPPLQQDEYGHWLQIDVDLTKEQLVLDGAEHLSDTDIALVKHLLANFKFIAERLRDEGQAQLQRDWEDWVHLGNRLNQMHQKSIANTLVRRTKRVLKRFVSKQG